MSQDASELFFSTMALGASSNVASALRQVILDIHAPPERRLCDYRQLGCTGTDDWLSVTAQILISPNETMLFKKMLLMFCREGCQKSDPRSDFGTSVTKRLLLALQDLPDDIAIHYDPIRVRAHLGDETSLMSAECLATSEQIEIAGIVGTDAARRFLYSRFADVADPSEKTRVAISLALCGDVSTVTHLRGALLTCDHISVHLDCAYALARLGDHTGMLYLLPLLEVDEEHGQSSYRLIERFRRDRGFVDVRVPEWRKELLAKFRQQLLTSHLS